MKAGEKYQVRAVGRHWIAAEITLASKNGKSLALSCDQTLGTAEGFCVDPVRGVVMLLLVCEGDVWRDVASGQVCELKGERDS